MKRVLRGHLDGFRCATLPAALCPLFLNTWPALNQVVAAISPCLEGRSRGQTEEARTSRQEDTDGDWPVLACEASGDEDVAPILFCHSTILSFSRLNTSIRFWPPTGR